MGYSCVASIPARPLHRCPGVGALHTPGEERLCRRRSEDAGSQPCAWDSAQLVEPVLPFGVSSCGRTEQLEGPDLVFSSGLSMRLLESKKGLSYFAFEHSEEYQQTQHKFLAAVESMEPNNIVVRESPQAGPGSRDHA